MLRGFYNAAAGMLAQQRLQDVLSNNMANADTPGFKADSAALRTFPNMLIEHMGSTGTDVGNVPNNFPIGQLGTSVYMQETVPNFMQGDLKETGVKTDMALLQGKVPTDSKTGKPGALFFAVNENGQEKLTRNGHFSVNSNGNIVTTEGALVLGTNGKPIHVASENFTVSKDGTITDNGVNEGQISVMYVADPNKLVKEGNGLFRNTGSSVSAVNNPNVSYSMQQGYLERSNVDMDQTMTDMLTAYRSFEANQKVLQAYDQSMEKAVNDVGKVG